MLVTKSVTCKSVLLFVHLPALQRVPSFSISFFWLPYLYIFLLISLFPPFSFFFFSFSSLIFCLSVSLSCRYFILVFYVYQRSGIIFVNVDLYYCLGYKTA
jgi:hypothetical protein